MPLPPAAARIILTGIAVSLDTTMHGKRVLRPREAWERAGLSRSSCYRLEAEGQFPRRIKLGSHASGYLESEIEAWIDARVAEREALRRVGK